MQDLAFQFVILAVCSMNAVMTTALFAKSFGLGYPEINTKNN